MPITVIARTVRRCVLTARYWYALGYSWHLAWVKAERRAP